MNVCSSCGSPKQTPHRQCDVCRALCVPDPKPDPHEAAQLRDEDMAERYS